MTSLPPPPIEVNPLLSKPVSDLILKALEKDPAKRFQNAAAFSDALRQATGIAAPTRIESSATFAQAIGAAPASGGRMGAVPVAAKTSRFPTAARRKSWIAAQAFAMVVVLVSSALGLPHFLRTTATAKTIAHASTQLPSLQVAQHVAVADTKTSQSSPTTPPDPTEIPNNDPAPPPAIASVPQPARDASFAEPACAACGA